MSEKLTPAELNRIYTSLKIRLNPSGFSFKDRLIPLESPTNCIGCTWGTEQSLFDKVVENFNFKDFKYIPLEETDPWTDSIEYVMDRSKLTRIGPLPALLSKSTNMYCDYKHINTYTNIIDPRNFVEHGIGLAYLMSTSKSISKYIPWMLTKLVTTEGFDNLINFEYLKQALENPEDNILYYANTNTMFTIPLDIDEICATDDDLRSRPDFVGNDETYAKILIQGIQMSIAYSLEIAYLMSTMSTEDKLYLHEILYPNFPVTHPQNNIMKFAFPNWKSKDYTPAIALDNNPKVRFMQIYEYIHSENLNKELKAIVAALMSIADVAITQSNGLHLFISYGYTLATTFFRTNQCAILYNFLNKKGLLNTTDEQELNNSTLLKSMDALFGGTDSDDSETSRDIMNLFKNSNYGIDVDTGDVEGHHNKDSMNSLLDGMIDNCKDGGYTFETQEVYDNSEATRTKYDIISTKVKLINSRLIKQIRDIKTYNTGGKNAGLDSGKLDLKSIHKYKTDPKIFYRNDYKQKECDLAFGIILDASGSMHGKGVENGAITMIVLHETLKALGINHSIIDHTSDGQYNTIIRRYQSFREDKGYRLTKNYALANINARWGNCDSGALYYMERALLRTHNKDKICLIFSDGAPTECSDLDLTKQVERMEHLGIKVIGIGINFPHISEYYPDYANGRNLKEMLDIVSDILKQYVLNKKE